MMWISMVTKSLKKIHNFLIGVMKDVMEIQEVGIRYKRM
jgi:hypothetical protein